MTLGNLIAFEKFGQRNGRTENADFTTRPDNETWVSVVLGVNLRSKLEHRVAPVVP